MRWRRGRGWQAAVVLGVAASLVVSMTALLVPFNRTGASVAAERGEFEALAWSVADSPLLLSLVHLPAAVVTTSAKLAGRMPLGESGRPLSGPRFPDIAFEHYGSHALLVWTLGCFLVAALALGCALALARRGGGAQKALLSSPPQ